MMWFDKNRGKVNMFSSVAISFGFSSSPLWVDSLIESNGWQGAWQYLGFGLLVASILFFICFKNKPEEYGLLPDGVKMISESEAKTVTDRKQFTLKEATATRAFWMYALILAFNSFFITGLTFHIVSILRVRVFQRKMRFRFSCQLQ